MNDLLAGRDWAGRIFSGGWVRGAGGSYAAVEPATGRVLAEVGAALSRTCNGSSCSNIRLLIRSESYPF
jgi:hypothetical protein